MIIFNFDVMYLRTEQAFKDSVNRSTTKAHNNASFYFKWDRQTRLQKVPQGSARTGEH